MRIRGRVRGRSVWLWVVLAVLAILLLGLLFGGYRKGTPINSGLVYSGSSAVAGQH